MIIVLLLTLFAHSLSAGIGYVASTQLSNTIVRVTALGGAYEWLVGPKFYYIGVIDNYGYFELLKLYLNSTSEYITGTSDANDVEAIPTGVFIYTCCPGYAGVYGSFAVTGNGYTVVYSTDGSLLNYFSVGRSWVTGGKRWPADTTHLLIADSYGYDLIDLDADNIVYSGSLSVSAKPEEGLYFYIPSSTVLYAFDPENPSSPKVSKDFGQTIVDVAVPSPYLSKYYVAVLTLNGTQYVLNVCFDDLSSCKSFSFPFPHVTSEGYVALQCTYNIDGFAMIGWNNNNLTVYLYSDGELKQIGSIQVVNAINDAAFANAVLCEGSSTRDLSIGGVSSSSYTSTWSEVNTETITTTTTTYVYSDTEETAYRVVMTTYYFNTTYYTENVTVYTYTYSYTSTVYSTIYLPIVAAEDNNVVLYTASFETSWSNSGTYLSYYTQSTVTSSVHVSISITSIKEVLWSYELSNFSPLYAIGLAALIALLKKNFSRS